MGIALIRLAAHPDCHRRSVVGKIPAGAGNAGIVGPRRMEAHFSRLVHEPLAPRSEIVLRLREKIVDRLLCILERARATFDQARKVGRHQHLGHFARSRLAGLLAQVFGAGVGQIDDVSVA